MMIIIKLSDKYMNQIDDILGQLNKIDFVDIVKNNPVKKPISNIIGKSKISTNIELEHLNNISIVL